MDWLIEIIFTSFFGGLAFMLAAAIMHFFPPKEINYLYGYRTAASMKSQDRWEFAQKYSTVRLFWGGFAAALLSIAGFWIPLTELQNLIIGLILLLLPVVYLFVTTEKALKQKFPSDVS